MSRVFSFRLGKKKAGSSSPVQKEDKMTEILPVSSPEVQHTAFLSALDQAFPGSELEEQMVDLMARSIAPYGFVKGACQANVSVCRDELCSECVGLVAKSLGPVFGMRSLAGLLSCGATGFGASNAHAPHTPENRRRFVYFQAVHIGIGEDGTFGECERPGILAPSSACGALMALLSELKRNGGKLSGDMDMDDVEMCALRKLLLPHIDTSEEMPDIVELTKLVASVIVEEQLKKLIAKTVDAATCDYAVITGVQIHAPGGVTYFCPSQENCYAVVEGERKVVSMVRSATFA